MGVVKPSESRRHVQNAIVLDLGDLRERADALCAEARSTAQRTIDDAQREREHLINTAHAEGFAKGEREGHAEGFAKGLEEGKANALEEERSSLDALTKRFESALAGYEQERDGMLSEAREQVLMLAIELARRVALRTVRLDPSVVDRQLERVLSLAIDPSRVAIGIHPADRARTDEVLPKLLDRFAQSPHAHVEEDDALERGSCVLRTDRGEIDASIGTMLDEITLALLPDTEGVDGPMGGAL